MEQNKTMGTREVAIVGVLLAICIVSQFFKNLSIFITGPIINACLVLAVLTAGLAAGVILAAITPVTAYFIAASPVMAAVPELIPLIMGGNIVLVIASYLLLRKDMVADGKVGVWSMAMSILCALLKGAFMWATISVWMLPKKITEESPLYAKLPVFQTTFSTYQIITAIIGMVYVFIIWAALRHTLMPQASAFAADNDEYAADTDENSSDVEESE